MYYFIEIVCLISVISPNLGFGIVKPVSKTTTHRRHHHYTTTPPVLRQGSSSSMESRRSSSEETEMTIKYETTKENYNRPYKPNSEEVTSRELETAVAKFLKKWSSTLENPTLSANIPYELKNKLLTFIHKWAPNLLSAGLQKYQIQSPVNIATDIQDKRITEMPPDVSGSTSDEQKFHKYKSTSQQDSSQSDENFNPLQNIPPNIKIKKDFDSDNDFSGVYPQQGYKHMQGRKQPLNNYTPQSDDDKSSEGYIGQLNYPPVEESDKESDKPFHDSIKPTESTTVEGYKHEQYNYPQVWQDKVRPLDEPTIVTTQSQPFENNYTTEIVTPQSNISSYYPKREADKKHSEQTSFEFVDLTMLKQGRELSPAELQEDYEGTVKLTDQFQKDMENDYYDPSKQRKHLPVENHTENIQNSFKTLSLPPRFVFKDTKSEPKDDHNPISDFRERVFNSALELLDSFKKKSNEYQWKMRIVRLANAYVDKFNDFLRQPNQFFIKTNEDARKAVHNIIDTSERILIELFNFTVVDMDEEGMYGDIHVAINKEIKNETDKQYDYACVQLKICKT